MAIESRECGIASKPCADLALDRLLLESVDETIRSLLGDEPHRVLFERLDNNLHLKHEEIPDRLEEFERALTFVFGSVAPVITRAIARCLYAKLQISYRDRKDYTLKMYIQDCRRQIEQHRAHNST